MSITGWEGRHYDHAFELATGIGGIGCARFSMFSGQRPRATGYIGNRRSTLCHSKCKSDGWGEHELCWKLGDDGVR